MPDDDDNNTLVQWIEQETEGFRVHDEASANWIIRKIIECRTYRDRVERWAAMEIKRAEREEPFFMTRFGGQLEAWARKQIAKQRGRKSVKLPAGTVGFRTEPTRLAVNDEPALLAFAHEIDGTGGPSLCMPAGGSLRPASHETVDQRMHYVKQDGGAVFKFAVRKTEEIALRVLAQTNTEPSAVDLFVSHQANRRIIQAAADRLGLSDEKVIINLEMYGNTTAGTIPLALADARRQKRIRKGSKVLLASVGAGFTVGSVLLDWALD
jgi:hypothetical protein